MSSVLQVKAFYFLITQRRRSGTAVYSKLYFHLIVLRHVGYSTGVKLFPAQHTLHITIKQENSAKAIYTTLNFSAITPLHSFILSHKHTFTSASVEFVVLDWSETGVYWQILW
jgi:hypothetical protein